MKTVELLDTTLRDGAQAEGISFSVRDKLAVVETLDGLGIPLIEAGNPGSNPKDLEFFAQVKKMTLKHGPIVAFGATCRPGTRAEDDAQLAHLLGAGADVVTIFGKGWDFHVIDVLKTTLEENLRMVRDTVAYCRARCGRVVYDAEHFFDGWRANPSYALQTVLAAAESGADVVCLCDTNGGVFPDDVARATVEMLALMKGRARVGIHAHNDSGLAVANSLAAVQAGATHVQGTLVGFGERCGNANLSTILANLQLKAGCRCVPDEALLNLTASVRRLAEIANVNVPDEMPFVGHRAFAHKGGMHIDGVRKSSASFEHIPPESVGNTRRFLMSEVAGRSTVLDRIHRLDPTVQKTDAVVASVVSSLKDLEQAGYQFEGADGSFELLIRKALGQYRPSFTLEKYKIIDERPSPGEVSSAMIKISVGGKTEIAAAEGDGPVNALDRSLRKALDRFYPGLADVRLSDYKVRVLDGSEATAAKVRVLMESTDGVEVWSTVGVSTDIIEASWIALVDSIEYKLIRDLESQQKQQKAKGKKKT